MVRPLLFRFSPEFAHGIVMRLMWLLAVVPGACRLLRWLSGASDPALSVRAFGRELPSPVGLAAGLDKNAEAYEAFGAIGFGFAEVGTLTAVKQPGNPRPRLFRLPRDRALINRMG